MSQDVKRSYRSQARANAANRTRAVIRAAAARLFVAQGVTATTMRQVAAEAGVAERTVYTVFPTKTALFNEVVDIATVGDELPVPVADRPEITAAFTETDPARAVEMCVRFASDLFERAGDLVMAAIESSGADPDMREFCERGSTATHTNMLAMAQAWEHNGLLRDGVDADKAGAILYSVCSPHVHHLLRRDRDWDVEQYRTWLVDTLLATVLRVPPAATSEPDPA